MCLLCIVSVSIYDAYLVVLFKGEILFDERNPICVMLIRKDPNSLTWFLGGKFLGNVFVVATLVFLRWIRYSRAMAIAKGVAAFQIGLLFYLTFADQNTGFLHFDGLFSNDPIHFNEALVSIGIHFSALMTIVAVGVAVRWSFVQLRRNRLSIDSVR